MKTINEYKDTVKQYGEHWDVAFRCFVDDFRGNEDVATMLAVPLTLDTPRIDALLASTIEALCDEKGVDPPAWVWATPGLVEPWFVSELEGFKAMLIAESPVQYRRRLLFTSKDFLKRV